MAPNLTFIWLLGYLSWSAAALAEKIPDLYPPEDLVQPAFWERNGLVVALLGLTLAAAAWLLVLWLRRPRIVTEEPLPARTRRVLLELSLKAEDDVVAGMVSGAIRKYLPSVMALPKEELTSDEIAWHMRQNTREDQDLEMKLVELLCLCDTVKYSPVHSQVPANLAARALALVDKLEARQEAAEREKQAGRGAAMSAGVKS